MLEISDEGDIRVIKLARPPVNALNGELIRKLIVAIEGTRQTASIVIAGQPGLFSAGLDVPGLLTLDRDGLTALFVDLWRAQRAIATSAVPIVFAINGHCPAGGTVLAINGDYRVMAQGEFRLGLNEVQVGLFPGGVIHGAFKRLVGGHTAQLLTRGALIDPATALRMGLVDELCDVAQVLPRALEVARELCALPREPMLRTRALARRDLSDLYGNAEEAENREREFGAMGAGMWFEPATQELLKRQFAKKR
ncbi:MAG TPA: enoyl-CoA hydratase/isomerase family protein [Steroidobacteraceae bacterium]|nr:enoyl-CoA hydratase/isomerase family protein [Steroidobacteraceae bacterium]